MYEINLAEFHVDLDGATERLDYLADLGVNCLSIMPVTNVASEVDWGYLPVGYFGVDERFGGNDKFKTFVDAAHERELAVIVDAVYGHASRAPFPYQYLYDQLRCDPGPRPGRQHSADAAPGSIAVCRKTCSGCTHGWDVWTSAAAPQLGGVFDRLPGCGIKRSGMGPAVVLGQDLGDGAGLVGDGAVADLAAGDRQLGNGHGEAAGR